jgi:hypothetical protein
MKTMHDAKCKMQKVTPVAVVRLGALARLGAVALCILNLVLATACAKAKAAELVPDGPPLAMSQPPPRVITPADEVPVASPPPPPSPEPTATAAAPPKPAQSRPRVDSKPEPPPAVVTQPVTPPPATPEPLEVRSVPSAAAAAEERKVRDVMQRAQKDLVRVTPQRLSAEGKSQYDQARRFYEQADEALKEKNFVYAMKLAENAATLAAELAAR